MGMDLTSMMGGSSGGGSSGMSSAGMSTYAAGSLQQDISGYLAPYYASKEQIQSINKARGNIVEGYDKAMGYQQPVYDQGMGFYSTLGQMMRGEINQYGRPIQRDSNGKPIGQEFAFDMSPETFSYGEQQPGYAGPEKFNFEADPGYQFRMQEGQNAVQSGAAAKGGLLSSATLKALSKYGQGLASEEYQNAYGRYQDQRNFGYNRYLNDLGQYNTNRGFAYNEFTNSYNRRAAEKANLYNRYNNMAQYGINAGNNLTNLQVSRNQDIANLELMKGNVRAGAWNSLGQAAYNQGQSAKDIGGMMMSSGSEGSKGSTSQQYVMPNQTQSNSGYVPIGYTNNLSMNTNEDLPYYG